MSKSAKGKATRISKKAARSKGAKFEIQGWSEIKENALHGLNVMANRNTEFALLLASTAARANSGLKGAGADDLRRFKSALAKKLGTDAQLVKAANDASYSQWRTQCQYIAGAAVGMIEHPDAEFTCLRSTAAKTVAGALKAGAAYTVGMAATRKDGKIDTRARNGAKGGKGKGAKAPAPAQVSDPASGETGGEDGASGAGQTITARRLEPAIAKAVANAEALEAVLDEYEFEPVLREAVYALVESVGQVGAEWDRFAKRYGL